MDYLKFHQLEREPFQNALDPHFYFESSGHARARLRIERGLAQRRGLLALVGVPGCGKSTLAHRLALALEPARYLAQLRVIPHSACASGWLLPRVAQAFGALDPGADPVRLVDQIHHALLVAQSRGRHPVLVIDEAQMLATADVMREFRGLLNLLEDGQPLLSIVLCGLLELDHVLQLDASLAQRVEVRCTLGPLAAEEVPEYVAHRLRCAGARGPVFAQDAVAVLAEYGCGVPRLLNTLADNALFESALAETRPASAESVLAAAEQLGFARESAAPAPAPLQPAAVAAVARAEPPPAAAPVAVFAAPEPPRVRDPVPAALRAHAAASEPIAAAASTRGSAAEPIAAAALAHGSASEPVAAATSAHGAAPGPIAAALREHGSAPGPVAAAAPLHVAAVEPAPVRAPSPAPEPAAAPAHAAAAVGAVAAPAAELRSPPHAPSAAGISAPAPESLAAALQPLAAREPAPAPLEAARTERRPVPAIELPAIEDEVDFSQLLQSTADEVQPTAVRPAPAARAEIELEASFELVDDGSAVLETDAVLELSEEQPGDEGEGLGEEDGVIDLSGLLELEVDEEPQAHAPAAASEDPEAVLDLDAMFDQIQRDV